MTSLESDSESLEKQTFLMLITKWQNLNGIPLKPNLQPNDGQLYHYVTVVPDYYMAAPFIIMPH